MPLVTGAVPVDGVCDGGRGVPSVQEVTKEHGRRSVFGGACSARAQL